MMALFIVLWLMSADEETKQQIAAYLNNPNGPGAMTGTAAAGLGNAIEVPKDDIPNLREKIQKALATAPNFRNLKDHVEITITADGLRIELLETEAGMFFESGRPWPTPNGRASSTPMLWRPAPSRCKASMRQRVRRTSRCRQVRR